VIRVCIRTDAGPGIGAGHVGRCTAIASALRSLGWDVHFACRPGTREGAPLLVAGGWPVLDLDGPVDAEADALAAALRDTPVDLLLIDHYGRDAGFEQSCRRFARIVAVLDDMPGHRPHATDILIDGAPGRDAADWRDHAGPDALILAGEQFAAIRPEILKARPDAVARRRDGKVGRVLISFGLSDSRNATEPALRAARAAFPSAGIDVVTGPTAPHRAAVEAAAEEVGAMFHLAPPHFVDLLAGADLAIGAGGVSALERACLGVPSVAVETAENQRAGLQALGRDGGVVLAGESGTLDERLLVTAMETAAADLAGLSARAAALIDGLGPERVASEMAARIGARQ